MSKKDGKDQYLHEIGKNEVLVIDKNMGFCQYIPSQGFEQQTLLRSALQADALLSELSRLIFFVNLAKNIILQLSFRDWNELFILHIEGE